MAVNKKIHENFYQTANLIATDKDGIPAVFKPIPYYPLELE